MVTASACVTGEESMLMRAPVRSLTRKMVYRRPGGAIRLKSLSALSAALSISFRRLITRFGTRGQTPVPNEIGEKSRFAISGRPPNEITSKYDWGIGISYGGFEGMTSVRAYWAFVRAFA